MKGEQSLHCSKHDVEQPIKALHDQHHWRAWQLNQQNQFELVHKVCTDLCITVAEH